MFVLPFGFDADPLAVIRQQFPVLVPRDGRNGIASGAAPQNESALLLHRERLVQSERHWRPCCVKEKKNRFKNRNGPSEIGAAAKEEEKNSAAAAPEGSQHKIRSRALLFFIFIIQCKCA